MNEQQDQPTTGPDRPDSADAPTQHESTRAGSDLPDVDAVDIDTATHASGDVDTEPVPSPAEDGSDSGADGDGEHPDSVLAAQRLEDLRRLQAEYVNYKKRVDRDRDISRAAGVTSVLESLVPVLDDVHLARQHGDLEGGPFEKIAAKLEEALGRQGVERFGEPGEAFDPHLHEALMNVEADLPEGATATTVVQVMQPGYRIGERVVRAARVAVADPS